MNEDRGQAGLSRREILLAGALALAGVTLVSRQVLASSAQLDEAMKALIGDAMPQEGRISLEVPQIAENGNTVPLKIEVDSPMTAEDHVKAVHIFAEGNPLPNVASFHFTPACGEAVCATRIRLAKTQNVVAVAEMSNGEVYMSKAEVKVTIGGCGG